MVQSTHYPQPLSWPPAAHNPLVWPWVFLYNVQTWLGKALCDAVVERLSRGCSMDYQEQSLYIKNYFSDKIEIQTSHLSDLAQVESEA